MSGYIDLNRTGFAEFDDVLTAIEEAGHAFHNTSQWQDEGWEGTPSQIDLINAKIDEAREALHTNGLIQVSRAEYEANRRDAERYRFWRDHHGWTGYFDDGLTNSEEPDDIDSAIDAAINMPANGEGGE